METPIHVAITRRVVPGQEQHFERLLLEFARRSLSEPGARGTQCLFPVPGADQQEYGILRTFATAADRDRFYTSPLFLAWLGSIEALTVGPAQHRDLPGLELWFRGQSNPAPAEWKMVLLTFIAVWPVSMAVPAALVPLWRWVPNPILQAGLVAAGIVVVLTWIAMPILTKLFRSWLRPKRKTTQSSL
jgi:hypothetical protein